ncbi:MAG: hypothetical protein ABIQ32_00195 [Sphingomicrobium sp.]
MTEAILPTSAPIAGTGPPEARRGNRAMLIRIAGIFIIMMSAGAALLPLLGLAMGTAAVGALLAVAGMVEMIAARARRETRLLAVLPGLVTAFAGVSLMLNPIAGLLRSVTIVTAWLLARCILVAINSRWAHGRVRLWLGLSAATDFVLGLSLLAGLSITTLFVTLFGDSPQLVAGFSWVLALSFVATGTMLLEVAGCERRSA